MKRQWTHDELTEHWTLLPDELKLLANKTGATRLGFGLLLKAFAYQGRFPRHTHELPGAVVVHVAKQVGVPAELYPSYEWSGRTIKYHRVQIREYLGFREATVQDGHSSSLGLSLTCYQTSIARTTSVRLCSSDAGHSGSSRRRLAASIGLSVR